MGARAVVRWISLSILLTLYVIAANPNGDYAKAAELKKIKLGYLAGVPQPIFFVAVDKGFFADEGIEIEIQNITGGSSIVVEVVASGQVDMGVCAPSSTILAIEKGVPIKLVGGFEYQFIDKQGKSWDGGILVCEDSDQIKKLEDLKGKKVAVNDFGSLYNYYLRYQLRKRGIDPDKDITIIPIPFTQMHSAIAKKQVDAAIMLPTTFEIAKKNMPLKLLMEGTRLAEMEMDLTSAIGVNAKFAKTYSEDVVKFLKGMIKSEFFIVKDKKENDGKYVKDIVQKWVKYKPDILEAWYAYRGYHGQEWDFVNPIQVPSSMIPKYSEIFLSEKLLKKPVTPETAIDNSFIKKAYAELGLKWDDKKGH